jgi:hypothetical protein
MGAREATLDAASGSGPVLVRRRRLWAALATVGIVAWTAVGALAPLAKAGADDSSSASFAAVGLMRFIGTNGDTGTDDPGPMLVDPLHDIGFTVTTLPVGNQKVPALVMYDLDRMTAIGTVYWQHNQLGQPTLFSGPDRVKPDLINLGSLSNSIYRYAIDPVHQRIYWAQNVEAKINSNVLAAFRASHCAPGFPLQLGRLDYGNRNADGTVHLSTDAFRDYSVPCSSALPTAPIAVSYSDPPGKTAGNLYLIGTDSYHKSFVVQNLGAPAQPLQESDGAPLLIAQVDLDNTTTAIDTNALSTSTPLPGVNSITSNPTNPPVPTSTVLKVDWTVDLRAARCGRLSNPDWATNPRQPSPFVQRVGDAVYSYCYDASTYSLMAPVGSQGYFIRIPLHKNGSGVDTPLRVALGTASTDALCTAAAGASSAAGSDLCADPTTGAILNAAVLRYPTLPGDLTPFIDPSNGNALLATDDPANGSAVWVYDPRPHAHRFIGVVPSGVFDQPAGNSAVGFDPRHGRLYMLTQLGLLVAPVRHRPLPPGVVYLAGVVNASGKRCTNLNGDTDLGCLRHNGFASNTVIPVAPNAHRIFVPVSGRHGWTVLQDNISEPSDPAAADPDSLTTQVPEVPGKTLTSASGAGLASGAHLVVAGGVTRTGEGLTFNCLNTAGTGEPGFKKGSGSASSQVCYPVQLGLATVFAGSPSDAVFAAGDREAYMASSAVAAGTDTGITAEASGLMFPSSDHATDADLKNVAACGASTIGHSAFADANQGVSQLCGPFQGGAQQAGAPDLSSGTSGADHKGYPVPMSSCEDFGSSPSADQQKPGEGGPQTAISASSVACDASKNLSTAAAASAALALPDPTNPVVAVGQTSSSVVTTPTADGQVTTALATASGIQIGPLSIAEVISKAVTKAHGNTSTAQVLYHRWWCGVTGPGIEMQGCSDPAALADQLLALNQALGKVFINLPPANHPPQKPLQASGYATPGGYQAVISKDPDEVATDTEVNDDNSQTVPAVEVILYNDGQNGRNRYILQLAGVQAESRYAIQQVLGFGLGLSTLGPEVTIPVTPTVPSATPLPPAAASTPEAQQLAALGGMDEPRNLPPLVSVASALPAVVRMPFRTPRSRTSIINRVLRAPGQFLRQALQLLVTRPGEFALLFATWALIGLPAYLFLRRRSLARAITL